MAGRHGVVFGGRSSADAGSWNAAYRAVYRLDFTGLRRTGTYRITVRAGAATAVSPAFAVVVNWPSVEPADDYSAISTLAFALAAASGH